MADHSDEPPPQSSRRRRLRVVILAVLVVGFAAIYLLFPSRAFVDELIGWIDGLGPWGMVVFGGVYVAATILFVPGSLLTLGAGFAFGLVWGTVVVSISSTIGAALAFLLGRYVAHDLVREKIAGHRRFQALYRAIEADAFRVVLLFRIVPAVPFNVLNYAFGLTRVGFWRYVLGSWVGMLPATLAYVYLGTTAGTIGRAAAGDAEVGALQWALLAAGAVAAVALVVVVTRRARRELAALEAEAAAQAEAEPPAQASM